MCIYIYMYISKSIYIYICIYLSLHNFISIVVTQYIWCQPFLARSFLHSEEVGERCGPWRALSELSKCIKSIWPIPSQKSTKEFWEIKASWLLQCKETTYITIHIHVCLILPNPSFQIIIAQWVPSGWAVGPRNRHAGMPWGSAKQCC